jgi:hypothetical protein
LSRSNGTIKFRIVPTAKIESGISGGKTMTPGASLEFCVMALRIPEQQ